MVNSILELKSWLARYGAKPEDIREDRERGNYIIIDRDEGLNGYTAGRITLPEKFQDVPLERLVKIS